MINRFKKVGTGTIEYVTDVACSNDCTKRIPINGNLPLPCKDYTNLESDLLRRRALKDTQLWASGFMRIIDRSAIGDDLRIRDFGIDIGEIRTEASGARSIRECKYNYESFSIEDWEKRFYVVNTNKHLKICPRDVVGSRLQDWIGDRMTDFDEFQDTTLADILVGAIIEKYNTEFVAKFMLLSVYENEGENMHGDDGIFAKAWYAHKGQYFHTVQYDYTALVAGKSLEAIVGGKRYSKAVSQAGGDVSLLLLDFVNWVNNLKEGKEYLYNASVDLTGKKVTVVSRFAATKVRLRTGVIDEGEVADWSGPQCSPQGAVPTVVLQNSMPINDTPLMFKYEEINESNFVSLFKRYTKEFMRYLHRNGWADLTIDDIKIGIDPELMLEKDDATVGKYLAGGISIDFMEQIGLSDSRFVPLNALNATGLFFMSIEENLLLLSDTSNAGNGLPGTGNVKIEDICDGQFGVIFDNPIGSAVHAFGAFAANLCDSYFVIDNDLDNRTPYENTRNVLQCYSDQCLDNRLTPSCNISVETESTIEYDAGDDETTITVNVNVANPDNLPFIIYELGYSLSDGTSNASPITTGSFAITLDGDQTQAGLVLNVFGNVAATDTVTSGEIATSYCTCLVNYSVQYGDGSASQYCTHSGAVDVTTTADTIAIRYDLAGGTQEYALIDAGLDLSDANDFDAIEDEIEAIFPGSIVTIEDSTINPGSETDVTIENVLGEVTNVVVVLDLGGAGETTTALTNSCA